MERPTTRSARRNWPAVLAAATLLAALGAIFFVAPTERTMGEAQRIVYVHVAVAWLGLAGFLVMAVAGGIYLARRDLAWDHWAHAAAELGWLAASLTLVTGSLWAHAAWGTWWTWDPRLTSSFVLWALYSGCLLIRGSQDDPHRSARGGAILAVLGAVDVPMIVLATHWFRGIHPATPQLDPLMRLTLWTSIVGFTAFFGVLLAMRRTQLHAQDLLNDFISE